MSARAAQRHLARERALEILYEATIKGRSVREVLGEQQVAPDPYTVELVVATEDHRASSEELIAAHALDWPLDRLALMDRLIMSLALGELRLDDAPPRAVVLDEAVELAKSYSTEASGSFVNGVLAACVESM